MDIRHKAQQIENKEQATHREMLDYKERYKRSEEKC